LKKLIYISFFYFFTLGIKAQEFGHFASAVYVQTCESLIFYNTLVERNDPDCINPNCNVKFPGFNYGTFFKNSSDLILKGAELKTFREQNANVCNAKMYYTIYEEGNRPQFPVFLELNLPHRSNCDVGNETFQDSYGPCGDRDQKWNWMDYSIDLTVFNQGNYALEIYFDVQGSHSSTSSCESVVVVDNFGNNFVAYFQIVDVEITADGPTSFCEGGHVTLTSSEEFNNLWITGETTQSITVNESGLYHLVIPSLNECITTSSAFININVFPNPTINAGNDISICVGESVVLSATGASNILWSNNVVNGEVFVPSNSNEYTVIGIDPSTGCFGRDTVLVSVLQYPISEIINLSGAETFYVGQTISFYSNSPIDQNYSWNFGNGNEVFLVENEVVSTFYEYPGEYLIVLNSTIDGYCPTIDSLYVEILEKSVLDVTPPNFFSPNGDGQNDEFYINVPENSTVKITILNRWGNFMYEINEPNGKWNGTVDGKFATEGVYFYTYEVKDEYGNVAKGQQFLNLIR
jgi:gliding motility-associated-like protein